MQENIQTINSSVFLTTTATTISSTSSSSSNIKPQGIQNSACVDSAEKVVYCFPTTATTAVDAAAIREASLKSKEKSEFTNNKQHVNSSDCMGIKVSLPSFWPALLANIGICALLIGYIFIGSFLFMSIENEHATKEIFTWHVPAFKLQQEQAKELKNRHINAHLSNYTAHNVVALNTYNQAELQSAHTQRMPHDKEREYQQTIYVDDDAADDDAVEQNDAEAEERRRTVENIWEITVSLNILYKENWTRLAALELGRFQNHLMKRLTLDATTTNHHYPARMPTATIKREFYRQQATLSTRQLEWRFSTAFLYSLTLVSTVGYGTLTPHTALGRGVTIAYATLGIPLMLIYLSSVGSILGKLMRIWCTRFFFCCCCCNCCRPISKEKRGSKKEPLPIKQTSAPKQQHIPYCYVRPPLEISPENATTSAGNSTSYSLGNSYDNMSLCTLESRHTQGFGWSLVLPVLLCLLLWLCYITIGSIIISLLEQWPLIDGIYFCFMSLTTIGFCDLLPGLGWQSTNSVDMLYARYSSNLAVWFCAGYILIGLTLISMCVNMLHEEILWRMQIVVKLNKLPAKQTKKQQAAFYGGLP